MKKIALVVVALFLFAVPVAAAPQNVNVKGWWDSVAKDFVAPFANGTLAVSMAAPPVGGATSAKQDSIIAGLASILAKMIAAPATEAKQDSIIANQTNGSQIAEIKGRDEDGTLAAVLIDKDVGAPVMLSWTHHLVHAGQLLSVSDVDLDVDIAGPKYYLFRPAAGTEWHLAGNVWSSGAAVLCFYEVPAVDSPGTQIQLYNQKRGAGDVVAGSSWIYDDPTFVGGDTGTCLFTAYFGTTGNPNQRSAGEARSNDEWVLLPEVDYLIEITVEQDNTVINANFLLYDEKAL